MTESRAFLLDLNVLIALCWPQHVHHDRAHGWFDTILAGGLPWATTPLTEAGFLRLSTNRAVVGEPVPMSQAIATLTAIRNLPGHRFAVDRSSLARPLVALTRLATSRQVTDAHLVNLAAETGLVLATLDRGIEELLEPADRTHVFLLPAG